MKHSGNFKRKNKIKYIENNIKAVVSAFDILKTVLFVFVFVILLFSFAVKDASIIGASMENTLFQGDRIILSGLLYTPKPGDIVAINAEDTLEKSIIKRVIAVEGQTICIDYSTGTVCVDGVNLDEEYTSSYTTMPNHPWQIPYVIPKGYVFVMGDNRDVSLDSRDSTVGLVEVKDIIGKAQFIIYPFDRISYLY